MSMSFSSLRLVLRGVIRQRHKKWYSHSQNPIDQHANALFSTLPNRRSYDPPKKRDHFQCQTSTFNHTVSTLSTSTTTNNIHHQHPQIIPSILSKQAATAPIDYPTSQRFWAALPPAIAIHLSIGSVYVYSMWTSGMSKTLGERVG